MATNEGELSVRWSIVREQLISLWALDSRSASVKELEILLCENISETCISLQVFNLICYFLLGFINKEERDKIIKWPIINTQDQVIFRKAVSKIVRDLVEKYSHLNMKKLPDSYLMDPNQNQKKILDFILRLSNVAIYLAVDDPYIFVMTDTKNLNGNEIEIAINTIKQVRLNEENEIQKDDFPLSKFDNIRNTFVNKCVSLKQENFNLRNELNIAKKYIFEKGIINKEDFSLNCLKEIYYEKLNEQKEMNKKLLPYCKLGQKIIKSVNAAENPIQLKSQDFGLSKDFDFTDAAAVASDRLIKKFELIKLKDVNKRKKDEYYKSLVNLKKTLIKEQQVLKSFINKCFVIEDNQTY